MKAIVRPAGPADIDSICTLLHTKMNTRIPVARWRQLMSYEWLADKPDFGRVVEYKGDVLGYCGMVYSDRMIGDELGELRKERLVSMSSWYLDKSMRGHGLGRNMLLSAIENPDLTYATLTNSRKPLGIVESLGFKVLEDHRYVWHKTEGVNTDILLINDQALIRTQVPEHQRQILVDMQGFPVTPMLLRAGGSQSLLIFSIKSKGEDVLWFDLQYVSKPALFVECAQSLANTVLPNQPSVLAADARFVRGLSVDGVREKLSVSRYFVSQRVAPHEIDHLYSELQLLDLKLD